MEFYVPNVREREPFLLGEGGVYFQSTCQIQQIVLFVIAERKAKGGGLRVSWPLVPDKILVGDRMW